MPLEPDMEDSTVTLAAVTQEVATQTTATPVVVELAVVIRGTATLLGSLVLDTVLEI